MELEQNDTSFHLGRVEDNVDPLGQHRVRVSVPAYYSEPPWSPWAFPKAVVGGRATGVWNVPPIGTQVVVEFFGGDPQYPVYSLGPFVSGDEPASILRIKDETPPEALPLALTQVRAMETRDWEIFVDERPGQRLMRFRAKGLGTENPDGTSLMLEFDREHGILGISAPTGIALYTGGRISIDGLVIDIGGRTVTPAVAKPI